MQSCRGMKVENVRERRNILSLVLFLRKALKIGCMYRMGGKYRALANRDGISIRGTWKRSYNDKNVYQVC